ncbi:aspartate aminotransferase family protein [Thermus scotoductus]|uniref:Aspartate aminotransferase family protein n=1 Tax=Thermus scotoductus TaxID=37636 RepID=A0A430SDE1_THESC|nr:aspartate aminotransferase family protein [Thermus scotoductus]RTG96572.1 aspartate aminotransferase family protein [Thermus scotoductus]RTH11277.1 aspartate aminotransferase family protein [Thermus scotoductus]RTH12778.1 aspartate aminotransferase family protein [Thermus scotoductus]RTH13807.1 aspartate aminotransferase family protein [Thermus scotoductus]RTH19633.1 aspartate aminotransferase family protein [Thermus scotoductus]
MDRVRIERLLRREQEVFARRNPRSQALAQRAQSHLPGGVPMPWMTRYAGPFPLFLSWAQGARVQDVDGHTYLDFALGDTGAMTGHSPGAVVTELQARLLQGLTAMLPTEDALWVAEELSQRFGLPFWQFTLSATDANRAALRIARAVTGRPKVLVFHGCYHGTVDEAFVALEGGIPRSRKGNLGPPVDPLLTTKVVEWNDPQALEGALAEKDVAAVLTEPVLTNVGIVHPAPGFLEMLRSLTRKYGTLLVLDETHTLCAGPGGCTARFHLEPDLLTLGKALGSGVPIGAYGLSREVAEAYAELLRGPHADTAGVGGTLAANAFSLRAARLTLERVLTEESFARMEALGERFQAGVEAVIRQAGLPWHVTRLGGRVEYLFRPEAAENGTQALEGQDPLLDPFIHLFLLNRGVLLTPFHNMALMSPATTEAMVDRHTELFAEAVASL